jgi:hypothetical protein
VEIYGCYTSTILFLGILIYVHLTLLANHQHFWFSVSYTLNEFPSINSRIKKGGKFKAEEMSLRVAVVGGGAAGLCAARHLSASG